ncbi:condensin-2 complex subunit H2 [Myripristis murdjan]|uniref:Condensin-2 complex subunit H2 n=1 Tax=Myripristis murdjan TaxID=586833 RepID=A0A667YNM2_9TELE|nr:condensin-2 complex subunit H2 [Myripristis murdjan]
MESAENRFAHLLQPIRELTKNWDIDVASELNDYLEELDEMCITFDGGRIKLNFIEAALLIQGSTCIYSKKVELLHSLVYQTLDYINDRNKKRDKQAASQDNDEEGASSSHDADNGAVFLCQDTVSESSQEADSSTSVHLAHLPPESLILPETHEKQKLPLISLKGEILGSHKDFRINTFIPGAQDLILLILGSACSNLLGNSQCTDCSNLLGNSQCTDCSNLLGNSQCTDAPAGIPMPEQQDAVPEAAADAGVAVANDDEGGIDEGEENFLPIEDNGMEMDHEPEEHIERHQAPSEGRMLRERRDIEHDKQRREEEKTHAANVWRLHDPYAIFGEDKSLKTGKCYKVPEGLDDGGKRKRKRPSSLQDFRSWFTGIFDPPEHKLKNGPTFTDLNYIYLSTMKDKLKSRKRILRKEGVVISDEELQRTLLQPEEQREQELCHPDLQGPEADNSDNEHEPFPDDIPAEFGGGQDFISPEAQKDELSYEDLVKKSVEQFLVNSRGYAQETALSRRVKDWEDKIRPELALQEERPAFDIHDYGDRIVGALNTVGNRRSFASIVHGLDNFEACKYMLASLQLANDYTVEIDSVEGLEESLDTMGLTLLSTHRATERFKTLKASAS